MKIKKTIFLCLMILYALCVLSETDIQENFRESPENSPAALLGEAYMIKGDYSASAAVYEKILNKYPQNLILRKKLAEVLFFKKDYKGSIQHYSKVVEAEKDNCDVMKKMALIYSYEKDFLNSENLYRKILEKKSFDSQVFNEFLKILFYQKKYDELISYAYGYLQKNSGNADIRLLLAEAYVLTGNYREALLSVNEVLRYDRENLNASELLADIYSYENKYAEALDIYKKILEKKPDNLRILVKIADVLSWNRQYDEAIRLYNLITETDDDPLLKLKKARILGWMRNYEASGTEYNKIADRNILFEIERNAKLYKWDNKILKAIKEYEILNNKDSLNYESLFDLAEIYSHQKMYKEAESAYNRILKNSKNHYRAAESLKKIRHVSEMTDINAEYGYHKADSRDRVADEDISDISLLVSYPVNYNYLFEYEHKKRVRNFRDFKETEENHNKLILHAFKMPYLSADLAYNVIFHDKYISDFKEFQGNVFFRPFDAGWFNFKYESKYLENSSYVILNGFKREEYGLEFTLNHSRNINLTPYYKYAEYSFGNFRNEYGTLLTFFLSVEPKLLKLEYEYQNQDYKYNSEYYFSPQNFYSNSITVHWRHFLNASEIFFGVRRFYYDLSYKVSADSENETGSRICVSLCRDMSETIHMEISFRKTFYKENIYEEEGFVLKAGMYF